MREIYTTAEWAQARARTIDRDSGRCSLGRLFGGDCHPTLHVHHLIPVEDGGDPFADENLLTVCQTHHPMLEAMRRYLAERRAPRRCRHNHRYRWAREECERRLARAA